MIILIIHQEEMPNVFWFQPLYYIIVNSLGC